MIELQIQPEVEKQLADQARAAGMTLNDFVKARFYNLPPSPALMAMQRGPSHSATFPNRRESEI